MKYIRTKESIYETIEYNIKDNIYYLENGFGIYKSAVIKQADTIEELCDEFVVVNDSDFYNGRDIYYQVYSHARHRGDSYYDFSFEQVRTGKREIGGTLYGAIWTNKGLIYVAKMNDKGELKLL